MFGFYDLKTIYCKIYFIKIDLQSSTYRFLDTIPNGILETV